MKRLIPSLIIVGAMLASVTPALAQRKALSPHETISATVDGDKVTIAYGRPYTRKGNTGEPRKIWGALVPWGKVWRTGADQATILTTEKPLVFGDLTVPPGKYSLFTLPVEEGTSKLIINKKTGQWGIGPGSHDESQDLGQVDLKKTALDQPVEQFTMAIETNPSGGGVIKMMWEKTQFSVPFTVKP